MISKDFRHIEQPQPDVLVQIDPLSSTTVCAVLALEWRLTLVESVQGEGIVSRFGIELLQLFCAGLEPLLGDCGVGLRE